MKFENAKKYGFVLEPRYYYFGWSKIPEIVGRPSVLKALAKGRKMLPQGFNFKIWDLQRPRYVQLAMLASFERRFKSQHPKWSKVRVWQEVFKFGAKPLPKVIRLDTHRNGGAVDLTIVDKNALELYMGTDHDDLTDRAATNYYENLKRPRIMDTEARNNRRLLIKVMTAIKFENYAPEWWHWSYDK